MTRLALRSRTVTLLFAVVQIALPAALGAADAMMADGGRKAVAHVEETSGKLCTAGHTADCSICRHLSTPSARGAAAPIPVPKTVGAQHAATFDVIPRSDSRRGFDSRAPPALPV